VKLKLIAVFEKLQKQYKVY